MQPVFLGDSALSRGPFQYPRSDRRRCNSVHKVTRIGPGKLSVSSVGSEAMQLSSANSLASSLETFSILGRIGGDATFAFLRCIPGQAEAFQYPRSDRRRCNLCNLRFLRRPRRLFQYPRSDRRRCNSRSWTTPWPASGLSVSSVGSEAMQPTLNC